MLDNSLYFSAIREVARKCRFLNFYLRDQLSNINVEVASGTEGS